MCQGCLLCTKELDVYTYSQFLRIVQDLSYFLSHDEKPMFLDERTVLDVRNACFGLQFIPA